MAWKKITFEEDVTSAIATHAALADVHHNRQHDHSLAADGSPIHVNGVPNLEAAKITSGRFGMGRMPDGTDGYVLTAKGAGNDPVYEAKSGDFSGQDIRIETRSSDPSSPADGRIWLRTDL